MGLQKTVCFQETADDPAGQVLEFWAQQHTKTRWIASDRAAKVQQGRPALKMSYQALPEDPIVDHRKNQGQVTNLLLSSAWEVRASVEVAVEYLGCL